MACEAQEVLEKLLGVTNKYSSKKYDNVITEFNDWIKEQLDAVKGAPAAKSPIKPVSKEPLQGVLEGLDESDGAGLILGRTGRERVKAVKTPQPVKSTSAIEKSKTSSEVTLPRVKLSTTKQLNVYMKLLKVDIAKGLINKDEEVNLVKAFKLVSGKVKALGYTVEDNSGKWRQNPGNKIIYLNTSDIAHLQGSSTTMLHEFGHALTWGFSTSEMEYILKAFGGGDKNMVSDLSAAVKKWADHNVTNDNTDVIDYNKRYLAGRVDGAKNTNMLREFTAIMLSHTATRKDFIEFTNANESKGLTEAVKRYFKNVIKKFKAYMAEGLNTEYALLKELDIDNGTDASDMVWGIIQMATDYTTGDELAPTKKPVKSVTMSKEKIPDAAKRIAKESC